MQLAPEITLGAIAPPNLQLGDFPRVKYSDSPSVEAGYAVPG